ncbi:hypothetical protein ECG_04185 [Echinococcus granulosus]|nr:hypothetical protein ECG_04185 [Echinococcus granulosus]
MRADAHTGAARNASSRTEFPQSWERRTTAHAPHCGGDDGYVHLIGWCKAPQTNRRTHDYSSTTEACASRAACWPFHLLTVIATALYGANMLCRIHAGKQFLCDIAAALNLID